MPVNIEQWRASIGLIQAIYYFFKLFVDLGI